MGRGSGNNIELQNWRFGYLDRLSEIFQSQSYLSNCDDYLPNRLERNRLEDWIHRIKTKSKGTKYFAIVNENEVIGGLNISFKQRAWHNNAEIGYFVSEQYWKSGAVTSALHQGLEYVFSNYSKVNRIIAQSYEGEKETQYPLVNNGFSHDATLPNYILKDDELIDCHIFSLLRTQFVK